jgi:CspA family cold shock protein
MSGARRVNEKSTGKRQDRILYCARCGVSFLWTTEEQAEERVQPRPQHCAGCRLILPPPERERGLVKWYNRRKRFGFITRKDQPDLFVHGSAVTDNRPLTPDELVEFSVSENDRGLTAADVVRLATPQRAEN